MASRWQIFLQTKQNFALCEQGLNICRTLSLSTVLSPTEESFVRETFTLCECYICSLNVLYTNSVIRAVAKKKLVTEAMSMKNFLYIFAKHFDRDKY